MGSGRFAVLVAGWPPAPVVVRHGGYGTMLTMLLREGGETWREFDCEDGRDLPTAEKLSEFDGVVISGSKHSAHDDADWIRRLRVLVEGRVRRGQRTVGICFGAQLMAASLGGASGPAGYWELGSRELTWGADRIRVHEIHSDAVSRIPPGASLLASSPRCRHEAWALGDTALAIQGHPEMTAGALRAILDTRLDLIGADPIRQACETLDALPIRASDTAHLVRHIHTYLKGPKNLTSTSPNPESSS